MTKAGGNLDKLKVAIDTKQALEAAVEKYRELHIQRIPNDRLRQDDDDSDDDSDFEEVVEKEGYEPDVPDDMRLFIIRHEIIIK